MITVRRCYGVLIASVDIYPPGQRKKQPHISEETPKKLSNEERSCDGSSDECLRGETSVQQSKSGIIHMGASHHILHTENVTFSNQVTEFSIVELADH